MKKMIFPLCVIVFMVIASCGGNKSEEEQTSTPEPTATTTQEPSATTTPSSAVDGKAVYSKTCIACHQADGKGVPKTFPPLASSDLLNKDVNGAIDGVLHGRTGEITVNGEKYNTPMAPLGATLSDAEIAAVLTYVYDQWGNNKTVVTEEMVKARRN